MFKPSAAFSGFSVHDTRAARTFYEETLGLRVKDGQERGTLEETLPGGAAIFLYSKPDHAPATFTVLNFVVDDLEGAVEGLNGRGVVTKIYEDGAIAGLSSDAKGIMRGHGPEIAWLRPSGNVLSALAKP
jgi:catechol 2,3-dioxygenase-like lactoylglutathione lyase family enzyme